MTDNNTEKAKKVVASDHESYNTMSIIAFLAGPIGILLGIIYLTKDTTLDRKLGEHLIAFSFLSFILWFFVWTFLFATSSPLFM